MNFQFKCISLRRGIILFPSRSFPLSTLKILTVITHLSHKSQTQKGVILCIFRYKYPISYKILYDKIRDTKTYLSDVLQQLLSTWVLNVSFYFILKIRIGLSRFTYFRLRSLTLDFKVQLSGSHLKSEVVHDRHSPFPCFE